MTKIKMCGLCREEDIHKVNEIMPDYIGFVFEKKSRRCVTPLYAKKLRTMLNPTIAAVGVFVNEAPKNVAALINAGVIDAVQLHGCEDNTYINQLRTLTESPIIKAFKLENERDLEAVENSRATVVLLDAKEGGSGKTFDWDWVKNINRPFFLAGGLNEDNVKNAIERLKPYGVDVSSGIETNGVKDGEKMKAFMNRVRQAEREETIL